MFVTHKKRVILSDETDGRPCVLSVLFLLNKDHWLGISVKHQN